MYSFSTNTDNFADYAQLPQTFLMIGDMGADPQAPNTIKILEQYGNIQLRNNVLVLTRRSAQSQKASVLLHNGDISYA